MVRIMLVEDDAALSSLLCAHLERFGYVISLESELGRGTTVRLDLRRRALRDMG